MTAIPLPSATSGPLPVLPLEPLPQLAYATEKPPMPPLVRAGRLAGLIGLLLAVAMLGVRHYDKDIPYRVESFLHLLIPTLQLIAVGAGLTLIALGKRFSGHPLGSGGRMAMTVNFASMIMAISEMARRI